MSLPERYEALRSRLARPWLEEDEPAFLEIVESFVRGYRASGPDERLALVATTRPPEQQSFLWFAQATAAQAVNSRSAELAGLAVYGLILAGIAAPTRFDVLDVDMYAPLVCRSLTLLDIDPAASLRAIAGQIEEPARSILRRWAIVYVGPEAFAQMGWQEQHGPDGLSFGSEPSATMDAFLASQSVAATLRNNLWPALDDPAAEVALSSDPRQLDELIAAYASTPPDVERLVLWPPEDCAVLAYARRTAERAIEDRSPTLLRLSVFGVVLAGLQRPSMFDESDILPYLAPVVRAAELLGLDGLALLRTVADEVSDPARLFMLRFVDASPEAQGLAANGWSEHLEDGAVRFERQPVETPESTADEAGG